MTTATRFQELLDAIPGGPFYVSAGSIIPFRNGPTSLTIATGFNNTNFLILINGIQSGFVVSDGNGDAIFNIILPLGDMEIELQREFSTDKVITYLTTRQTAVWLEAIAESLSGIDTSVENTLKSFYLEQTGITDIDLAHGVPLQYPNEAVAELEAYRETLQLVRQSFRQFGGRLSGKAGIVAALTQINPLIFERFKAGPRWVLGFDEAIAGELQSYVKVPTSALTNINAIGTFVTLNSVEDITGGTSGPLEYLPLFDRFRWRPPALSSEDPSIDETDLLVSPEITGDGQFTIPSGRARAIMDSLYLPHTITAGEYDYIFIEIDGRGIVAINLFLGSTLSIADKINAALQTKDTYALARTSTQFTGAFEGRIWILEVSNGTLTTSTGVIAHTAGNSLAYTAPGDIAGAAVVVPDGTIATLTSDNGVDTVKIWVGGALPGATGEVFSITSTYLNAARLMLNFFNDQLRIESKAKNVSQGLSKVTIHDGPANAAAFPVAAPLRGIYDIPKIATTIDTDIAATNISILVPNAAAEGFSLSNGVVHTPFDAIVGYGYKSTSITSFKITPGVTTKTAEIEILTGGIFEAGDDYVVLQILGNALSFTQPAGIHSGFITINSVQSGTSTGVATIDAVVVAGPIRGLRYSAPGDAFGPTVTIAPSAQFGMTLTSSNGKTINIDHAAGSPTLGSDIFTISAQNNDSRNNGLHKILNITTTKKATISYGGLGIAQPGIAGIFIIALDPRTTPSTGANPSQNGDFVWTPNTLTWQAPNDTPGAAVDISSGGYFRLFSNNGTYVDLLVNQALLPGAIPADLIKVGRFQLHNPSDILDTARVWATGEKVRVTNVTPGTPETWDLESPIVGNFDSGMTIYHANDQLPLNDIGDESAGSLTLTVDKSEEPTVISPIPNDNIALNGSVLPEKWLDTSTNVGLTFGDIDSRFGKSAIKFESLVFTDGTIEQEIPLSRIKLGAQYILTAWVRNMSPTDGTNQNFVVGFDFGSGFIDSGVVSVLDPDNSIRHPVIVQFAQIVPRDATQIKIHVSALTNAENFIVERITLIQSQFSGLYTGNHTTPRSDGRSKFGSLFYVWSPDLLSTAETNLLGIPTPAASLHLPVTSGSIANVHNAHEEVDAFDITDIVGPDTVNVRGAMTDTDWGLATLTNLSIVARTPARFSHVKPTIISQQNETLVVSQTPAHTATLSVTSDQDQLNAILFENEIPVEQSEWSFNSATVIEITIGEFTLNAVYRLEYQALTQAETDPIDITIPAANGNDTWFADYVAWNRHDVNPITLRDEISITFNASLEATLPINSDQDKLNSILTENTGVTTRVIPQNSWNYLDSKNIGISGTDFNSDSLYTLTYNQQIPKTQRVTSIVSEVRSAANLGALAAASYLPFSQFENNFVDGSLRFHQIRLTVSGIVDLRDVRIHSAVIKGMRLNTAPVVPGL